MALIKPVIKLSDYGNILPFDATKDYTFYFSNTGDQVFKNEIKILNSTGTVVYDNTVTSFLLQSTVPANTLTNGNSFSVSIRVGDSSGNFSDWSTLTPFLCLSDGKASISNITDGKINNQTYLFQGVFTQAQSETIQSYQFYLYDSSQNSLSTSGTILYSKDNSLSFEFGGFENNLNYYINFVVTTVNNRIFSTGLIPFTASYITPRLGSALTLTNVSEQGAVEVQAKIIQIIGQMGSGTPIYINNEEIDLKNDSVTFQDGFSIDGDFTLRLWLRDITKNVAFLTLYSSNNGRIELTYDGQKIILYRYINDNPYYFITSNDINVTSENDKLYIFVQQNISTQLMNLQAKILN